MIPCYINYFRESRRGQTYITYKMAQLLL